MLREIKPVKRSQSPVTRRWFTDTDMDLFVWFHDQMPIKFHLSFGKRDTEYALSWRYQHGLSDCRVDAGESQCGRYKMSPLLLGGAAFNVVQLARDFLVASEAMETSLADFIYARLLEHPRLRSKLSDQGERSTGW